jgi:zinc transporter
LVTAIFLPLSFLTGVFGMNVAGLPGTEEPNAFFYLAMAMLTVAIILLISMLWKKWF